MHIIQAPQFDFEAFMVSEGTDRVVVVLEALPAEKLLVVLERGHWTGRKGYSVRGMWSALVAGLLYKCSSITDVVHVLKRNKALRMVSGFGKDTVPSEDALGRFIKKLTKHQDLLEECFTAVVQRLGELLPLDRYAQPPPQRPPGPSAAPL